MKRFVHWVYMKFRANTRQYITAYETWSKPSHASYTLDRCNSFKKQSMKKKRLIIFTPII